MATSMARATSLQDLIHQAQMGRTTSFFGEIDSSKLKKLRCEQCAGRLRCRASVLAHARAVKCRQLGSGAFATVDLCSYEPRSGVVQTVAVKRCEAGPELLHGGYISLLRVLLLVQNPPLAADLAQGRSGLPPRGPAAEQTAPQVQLVMMHQAVRHAALGDWCRAETLCACWEQAQARQLPQ